MDIKCSYGEIIVRDSPIDYGNEEKIGQINKQSMTLAIKYCMEKKLTAFLTRHVFGNNH